MVITGVMHRLGEGKLELLKKVLRMMNSSVLSHSLFKHPLLLENPMTGKISCLLQKDKNMKVNSPRGLSGPISRSQATCRATAALRASLRSEGVTWIRSQDDSDGPVLGRREEVVIERQGGGHVRFDREEI